MLQLPLWQSSWPSSRPSAAASSAYWSAHSGAWATSPSTGYLSDHAMSV